MPSRVKQPKPESRLLRVYDDGAVIWYRWSSASHEGVYYDVGVGPYGNEICMCPNEVYRPGTACTHIEKTRRVMSEITTAVALRPIEVRLPQTVALPDEKEQAMMAWIADAAVKAKGAAVPATIDSREKAIAIMLAGREMGIAPMTAFRHLFMVNGRTEPDAQLMMGLVKANDPTATFEFLRYDEGGCSVRLVRGGKPVISSTYTLEMAERAGQLKRQRRQRKDGSTYEADGPWQLYQRDMLAWAAIKRACRLGAPDLINGIVAMMVDARAVESGEAVEAALLATPVGEGIALEDPSLYSAGDDPAVASEVLAVSEPAETPAPAAPEAEAPPAPASPTTTRRPRAKASETAPAAPETTCKHEPQITADGAGLVCTACGEALNVNDYPELKAILEGDDEEGPIDGEFEEEFEFGPDETPAAPPPLKQRPDDVGAVIGALREIRTTWEKPDRDRLWKELNAAKFEIGPNGEWSTTSSSKPGLAALRAELVRREIIPPPKD